VARFHELCTPQMAPGVPCGRGGWRLLTVMSRVIVAQSPSIMPLRASLACHVPAAGVATSAYQKYGGPSWRSRELAATLPSGATSDSSAVIGFAAVKMTRSGMPCHGATGVGRTAIPAASSQALDGVSASAAETGTIKDAPEISDDAVTAATSRRAESKLVPLPLMSAADE
jgi:hypothetical protein